MNTLFSPRLSKATKMLTGTCLLSLLSISIVQIHADDYVHKAVKSHLDLTNSVSMTNGQFIALHVIASQQAAIAAAQAANTFTTNASTGDVTYNGVVVAGPNAFWRGTNAGLTTDQAAVKLAGQLGLSGVTDLNSLLTGINAQVDANNAGCSANDPYYYSLADLNAAYGGDFVAALSLSGKSDMNGYAQCYYSTTTAPAPNDTQKNAVLAALTNGVIPAADQLAIAIAAGKTGDTNYVNSLANYFYSNPTTSSMTWDVANNPAVSTFQTLLNSVVMNFNATQLANIPLANQFSAPYYYNYAASGLGVAYFNSAPGYLVGGNFSGMNLTGFIPNGPSWWNRNVTFANFSNATGLTADTFATIYKNGGGISFIKLTNTGVTASGLYNALIAKGYTAAQANSVAYGSYITY
jgi:hypothetical protein